LTIHQRIEDQSEVLTPEVISLGFCSNFVGLVLYFMGNFNEKVMVLTIKYGQHFFGVPLVLGILTISVETDAYVCCLKWSKLHLAKIVEKTWMMTGSATVSWNFFPIKGWLKFDKLGYSFNLATFAGTCWDP